MDYKKLGYDLLPLVGGVDNISKLTHCATRLRFEFCDRSKVDCNRKYSRCYQRGRKGRPVPGSCRK